VRVMHLHPEWTFGDLLGYVGGGGTRSAALRGLTMSELLTGPEEGSLALPCDGGPAVDVVRLEQAKRAHGEEFDRLLAQVLAEAGRAVSAGYLRARVGGPRWKLQAALGRLVVDEIAVRTGVTSATRYEFRRPR
jgi:hypothetical protein